MVLTPEQRTTYQQDGYLILRGLFTSEEITLLKQAAVEDRQLDQRSFGRADGEGGTVRLSVWNHPGNGIYGMFARHERLVNAAEDLLGGEVYHYHSKMILKDAKVGGAWTWHQDYGYWYHFGLLEPLLTSVTIAVDKATVENGCLQVLRGSHKMGRVEHLLSGDQAGANLERVDEAKKRFALVHCEMEPGDAMFFDCNILHRSDQNTSDHSRWSLICCYNAARNDPYQEGQHASYTPLKKVSGDAIRRAGEARSEEAEEMDWISPEGDTTAEKLTTTAK